MGKVPFVDGHEKAQEQVGTCTAQSFWQLQDGRAVFRSTFWRVCAKLCYTTSGSIPCI